MNFPDQGTLPVVLKYSQKLSRTNLESIQKLFPHSFAILPKLCKNCDFPKHFYTRKLGEISVLYVVLPLNTLWWCVARR